MANEISITDLQNAKSDVQTIAEVAMVDYTADTTTNRNGDILYTLQGQLKRLGYAVPITYAGSIVFGIADHTKTIDESGIIYAPKPSELPFTTTGTWLGDDDGKFYVVQTGSIVTIDAINVNYDNVASGLTATTAQDAIDELDGTLDSTTTTASTAYTRVNNVITLTGRAANSTHLGTFSGTTIPDNQNIKNAIQYLETAHEALDAEFNAFDSTIIHAAMTSSGTTNAITATCSPALTSLFDGAIALVRPSYVNTSSTVTFAPNGLTAKQIHKYDGQVEAGDIDPDMPMFLVYDLGDTVWRLLNPKKGNADNGSGIQVYDGDGKTFTIAHNLGAAPRQITPYAQLQSGPDVGYSTGAKIVLTNCGDVTYEADATNIYIHVSSGGISIINKSTYANGTMSTASIWDIGAAYIA